MSTSIAVVLFVILQVVGGEGTYVVRNGDSLTSIAARYGMDVGVMAKVNRIQNPSRLETGQILRIDNRHIVPDGRGVEIVINVPQRMLFHFRGGVLIKHYPIGAGMPSWPTPLGMFEIVIAETDPVWDVPPSIQAEMLRQGRSVVTKVPPGPDNPLGKHWLGLTMPGVGIHGTNAPSSVYGLPSHGCIRLHPDDIHELFLSVGVGTRGTIIYEPVLISRVDEAIFVEAHPDAYGREPGSLEKIREDLIRQGLADRVDWSLVQEVIRLREGIARQVSVR